MVRESKAERLSEGKGRAEVELNYLGTLKDKNDSNKVPTRV